MPIKIQDRDVKIIQEIAECRFLSMNQIADLCFEGNREAARKRLEKLVRAGGLNCFAMPQFGRIFSLHRKVLSALADFRLGRKTQAATRIPLATLEHELVVRDFRVAVLGSARQAGFEIKQLSIDSQYLSFEIDGVVTRPDGFFEAETDRTEWFFFEVDAGSESLDVLLDRLKCYRSFYRSGRFARWIGERSDRFRSFPFRVIFLFKTARRRDSALKRLSTAGYCGFTVTATWDMGVAIHYWKFLELCDNTPDFRELV